MAPGQSASLQLPSFLHGTYRSARQKAKREGVRCGEQYQKDGTFLLPRQMVDVPPGEVVVAHDVVDFHHERPAWRLYLVSDVMSGLLDAVDPKTTFPRGMRTRTSAWRRPGARSTSPSRRWAR